MTENRSALVEVQRRQTAVAVEKLVVAVLDDWMRGMTALALMDLDAYIKARIRVNVKTTVTITHGRVEVVANVDGITIGAEATRYD